MPVLISARTTLALRCPQCGRMEMVALSRFELQEGAVIRRQCSSCANHLVTVARKRGQVSLQIPCYLCDGVHFSYYAPRTFWSDPLKQLACTETDLQMGAFGNPADVAAYARPGGSELDRLLEDTAFDDYFEHREAMYQVVTLVNTLADDGKVTCTCSSQQIAIDLFPDRLELTCTDCGSHRTLSAGKDEDLHALASVTQITVGDDKSPRRKKRRNSKDRE